MDLDSFIASGSVNIDFVDALYSRYQEDPNSIDSSWQQVFRAFDNGAPVPHPKVAAQESSEQKVFDLIEAYRTYGHLKARINPIAGREPEEPWQLNIKTLGFLPSDLDKMISTFGLLNKPQATLKELIDTLESIYCREIGVEYMGVQNPQLQRWLQEQIEPNRFKVRLSIEQKKMILQHLNKSELFESFLHTKYTGQKRFSLEGGETLIPMLAAVMEKGAGLGLTDFYVGMAHRGRLNVLCNILDKSYSEIFSEFEERYIPASFEGSGDVKYHKGFSSTVDTIDGNRVRISLAPNPSHLEAVDPVVEGQVRARQVELGNSEMKDRVVPILVHGDAAIAGQGIIYETLQMYDLEGYSTGGTIHLVINNQIGFTTVPRDGRSTYYCTDIARAFNAPVFHVNAEDPEACIFATYLAVEIRQKFHCDVFIDLYCYRKYGHNEMDEPAFTQPLEYRQIRQKKAIREIYRDDLIHQGVLERHMAESLEEEFKAALQEALQGSKELFPGKGPLVKPRDLESEERQLLKPVNTAVSEEVIRTVAERLNSVPEGFEIHKKIRQLADDRLAMTNEEGKHKPIDWGMGELLAYATLLWEGTHVRLSGQDCGRGTFSHRHAVWMDQESGKSYCPLQHLKKGQGRFDIYNSLLSEYAVLGFEYGYSIIRPDALVIWEAQFGDFANGAQVVIDQFISTSEQKWGQPNSITLFLPHGYEGQGPEHSSGRIERFLTGAGDENMQICVPTTPAQMFHLLRRQVKQTLRKPLIIFTPKSLLRNPQCVSTVKDLTAGCFREIIDNPISNHDIRRLVFCSGKVYYDLLQEREKHHATDLGIVRIEQLYPLNQSAIKDAINSYINVEEYWWVQEEPSNMGAWTFIQPLLQQQLPEGQSLHYAGRERTAATATGSVAMHKQQYQAFMDKLFSEGKPSIFEVASRQS